MVHGFPEEVEDSKQFFSSTDCNEKKTILDKYSPDYIFSRSEIRCSFLKLEYKDKDYIYSIKE